jgi:protein TonB
MTVPFFAKPHGIDFLRDSFTPVIIVSLLFHALFFTGIMVLTKAFYKSKEFDRPYTFELIRLSQVFEMPIQPKQAAAPHQKSAAKPVAPAPVAALRPQPVAEKNPVAGEQKTAEPAQAEPSAAAPSQAAPGNEAGPANDAAVDPNRIYETGMLDELPVLLKRTDPFYPEFVKDQEISGTVKAQVLIDQNGNVIEIKILSSPHELLSDEVIKAVSRWKYKPGKFRGVAVKVRRKDVQVEFRLTD